MNAVLPGAEPFSADGGPHGALVLHGFTGCPQSMRGLGEAFAAAGHAVDLPLLPGHGTAVEDMVPTRWDDWLAVADDAYRKLEARCDRIVVAGLSMGGTLGSWLAAEHDPAGLVAINAAVEPTAESFRESLQALLAEGTTYMPALGNDVADPASTELAYDAVPVAALLSLLEAVHQLDSRLPSITCSVLVLTSRQDHLVPPSASDHLAGRVSGPVERLFLERSYHVATIDYEREDIERAAVDFAARVTSAGS